MQHVPVESITVTGAGNATSIETKGGTLQMSANVAPVNAPVQGVTWSVESVTGQATINQSGLLTAVTDGVVRVVATSNDPRSSGIKGSVEITISNQSVPVESITVTGKENATEINTMGGTLQMVATVSPVDATIQGVTWSVVSVTGKATITQNGLLTAVSNGVVRVVATSNEERTPAVSGSVEITITNQPILFYDFENYTIGDLLPFKTGWNQANITVEVADDPLNTGNNVMRITNTNWNAAPALMFTLKEGTTLADYTQFKFKGRFSTGDVGWKQIRVIAYTNVPAGPFDNANQQGVTIGSFNRARPASTEWEDITINIAGSNQLTGTIYLAFGFNNSASTWFADNVELVQHVPVESIVVTGAGSTTTITTNGGTLQMSANVAPVNATIKGVTWSVESVTGQATINQSGLLTAVTNGVVRVVATTTDARAAGIKGSLEITISNQIVQVASITVTGKENATGISTMGGTLQMVAEVLPANATDLSVTWSVSDPTIATISETGLLTALKNGEVTVTATSVQNPTISGTSPSIVITNQDISVNNLASQFVVYPVPASSRIYIRSELAVERAEIIALDGRIILSAEKMSYNGSIELSNIPAGTYFLRIYAPGGQSHTTRIVRQ